MYICISKNLNNMEKLDLKRLAGYLPHRLKCNVRCMATEETEYNENPIYTIYTMIGLYTDSKGSQYAECSYKEFVDNVYINTDLIPILRPLSDLTKQDINSFSVDVRFALRKCNSEKVLNTACYYELQWLLENHYDIHGLIEKGLAIDINTLKTK